MTWCGDARGAAAAVPIVGVAEMAYAPPLLLRPRQLHGGLVAARTTVFYPSTFSPSLPSDF